jgi:hypothetical protein
MFRNYCNTFGSWEHELESADRPVPVPVVISVSPIRVASPAVASAPTQVVSIHSIEYEIALKVPERWSGVGFLKRPRCLGYSVTFTNTRT